MHKQCNLNNLRKVIKNLILSIEPYIDSISSKNVLEYYYTDISRIMNYDQHKINNKMCLEQNHSSLKEKRKNCPQIRNAKKQLVTRKI